MVDDDISSEEVNINLNKWHIGIICLVMGFIFGTLTIYFYQSHSDYRSPEEIAVYLEEMLFEKQHTEDLQHSQLSALIYRDTTTIAEFKSWYERYNSAGMAHNLLIDQVNKICFKREFKLKCQE